MQAGQRGCECRDPASAHRCLWMLPFYSVFVLLHSSHRVRNLRAESESFQTISSNEAAYDTGAFQVHLRSLPRSHVPDVADRACRCHESRVGVVAGVDPGGKPPIDPHVQPVVGVLGDHGGVPSVLHRLESTKGVGDVRVVFAVVGQIPHGVERQRVVHAAVAVRVPGSQLVRGVVDGIRPRRGRAVSARTKA